MSKQLWGDEWASVFFAKDSLGDVFQYNIRDTHPPLYYLFLHLSIKLIGFNEWAFRIPSLIAGISLIPAVWLLGCRLLSRKAAFLAALIIGTSPFFIHQANEIRNHGTAPLFCVLGSYFFYGMLNKNKFSWASLSYVLCSIAAINTSHFSWFWFAGQWAVHAYLEIKNRPGRIHWLTQGVILVFALPNFMLMTAHFIKNPNFSTYHYLHDYSPVVLVKVILGLFYDFTFGPSLFLGRLVPYLGAGILFLVIKKIWEMRVGKQDFFIQSCSVVLFPIVLIILVMPVRLDARYFGFASPFFILILAEALSSLKQKWMRRGIFIFMFLWMIVSNWVMFSLEADPVRPYQSTQMLSALSRSVKKEDLVTGMEKDIFDYYLRDNKVLASWNFVENLADQDWHGTKEYKRIWWLDAYAFEINNRNNHTAEIFDQKMKEAGFKATHQLNFRSSKSDQKVTLYEKLPQDL